MKREQARKVAEEHWEWLEPLLHELYIGAFMHGVKHEKEGSNVKPKSQ